MCSSDLQLSQGMTKSFFRMHNQLQTLHFDKIQNEDFVMTSIPIGINLENVSYSIPSDSESMPILQNISAQIAPGDLVSIIGTSGAGKTTLVDLVARLLDESSGQISYFRKDGEKVPTNRNLVAYCTQTPYIFDTNLEENISISRSHEDQNKLRELIAYFNLNNLVERADVIHTLSLSRRVSGGERQRIGLARVFFSERPISIFDEPTSALDKMNAERFIQLLELNRGKTTQIVVTHGLEIARLSDKLMVIEAGELVYFGAPRAYLEKSSLSHE